MYQLVACCKLFLRMNDDIVRPIQLKVKTAAFIRHSLV